MRRAGLLAALWLATALPAVAAEWSVAGSVDRRVVSVGEPLEYSLVIRGSGAREARVQEPNWAVAGLRRVSQSSSYSTRMNIGSGGTQVNSEQTYAYTLVAEKPGDFDIGPFTVTQGSQGQRTLPIRIIIKPAGTVTPGQAEADFWVEAQASAEEVYAGQQVHVVYRIVTRKQIRDLNFPVQPDFSGYWVEDHSPSQVNGQQIIREGISYTSAVLRDLYLFPIHAGEMQIPAVTVQAGVVLQQRAQRGGLFEMFTQQPGRVQTVASPVMRLNVLPLPEAGRPQNFSGAVGQFNLQTALDRTAIKMGDAITLTLTLTGTGHPNSFPEPEITLPSAFEIYPPEAQVQTVAQDGRLLGKKSWRYLLVGREPGKQVLSPAAFSYFDPQQRAYRSVRSDPVEIIIEGPPGGRGPSSLNRAGAPAVLTEIHFIKPNRSSLPSSPVVAWRSPLFWIVQGAPWLSLLGVVLWRRLRERRDGHAGQIARHQAARNAKRRLSSINDRKASSEVLGEIERALMEYLTDRTGQPMQGVTRSELRSRLESHGLSGETLQRLAALLDRLETHRYAGAETDPGSDRKDALGWIESAEKEWT